MRRPHRLSPWSLCGGLLIAGLLAPIASPAPARAADDGLRIVTDATYDARPDARLVHVTIDATATNTTPDTADGRTSFTGLVFVVQPGATNIVAAAGDVALPLVVDERTVDFTSVDLTYHRSVFYQQVYRYTVSYDLPDAGDTPDRDVRVTPSVLAFPVWAFGTSGVRGSSISVHLPPGYAASVDAGPLSATSNDAGTTLSAVDLADPFTFFAYVSADRPGAFVETRLSVGIDGGTAPVIVRAWEDDEPWGGRTADLMQRGLPTLAELIGLPYPVNGRLRVEEAATSRLGEYAGTYNDLTELITVRYDADAIVGLHEAAHIWFNESLLEGRWIGEAWAEWYAVQAADALHEAGATYDLTDDLLAHRIALNDWGAFGVEDLDTEDYAYAATYHVAELIAARTDIDGLRRVWRAAAGAEMSYQPAGAEIGDRPVTGIDASQPDWERLLDLLEERTDGSYADLWRTWIVTDADRPLLDRRAATRVAYDAAVDAAGAWELPAVVRHDLGGWRFDAVDTELATVDDILDERDRIAARAASLDLAPSDVLRRAFEGGPSLDAASAMGTGELATLAGIDRSALTVTAAPSALEWAGLLGTDPGVELAAARNAYERGDLDTADTAAAAALAGRDGADETGRLRVGVAGGALLGVDLLAMTAIAARRSRRRRARDQRTAPLGGTVADDR